MQNMMEGDFSIAVVSEPYVVPREHSHWVSNDNKTIAITWRQKINAIPCTLLMKGRHFVLIRWGDIVVVGTYMSPNMEVSIVEKAPEEMENWILQIWEKPIFVMGDFNAKSNLWQAKTTDQRGIMVTEWASRVGLCCLNRGGKSTFIGNFGESIIDLTFANPTAAHRVTSWIVSNRESKSDHSTSK